MRIIKTSPLFAATILVLSASSHAAMDRDIHKYVCEKLDDFTANVTIVRADQRELGKISKDFGMAYRIPNITMRYKEPNLVRMEGTTEGSKITYILTGNKQIFMLNGRRITEKDFGKSPGKRKS